MPADTTRSPDVLVTANNIPIAGVLDVEVESNSFLSADRFRLSVVFNTSSYPIWASDTIDMVISVGLTGCWAELIRGVVDRVEVDLGAGHVFIEGRDLTAKFIDARTQETFENQTSSQIVERLANRRGLLSNVTSTTALIGRNYGGDHSRVTLDQYSSMTTEWDLMTRLAAYEGFDVWVTGETLNFVPPLTSDYPIVLRPSDCQSIRLDRAVSLNNGLSVTVKSWDCRAHSSVSQVASTNASNSGQNYILIKPNLTELEAAETARRVLAQMLQNSRIVTLECPGDLTTKPRQSLSLINTNTDFDGLYVVTSVERRLSFQQGFTEIIQARTPPWTIS